MLYNYNIHLIIKSGIWECARRTTGKYNDRAIFSMMNYPSPPRRKQGQQTVSCHLEVQRSMDHQEVTPVIASRGPCDVSCSSHAVHDHCHCRIAVYNLECCIEKGDRQRGFVCGLDHTCHVRLQTPKNDSEAGNLKTDPEYTARRTFE